MSEERLVNIEVKLAFQEDLIETLNKMVYEQQQKLKRLETLFEGFARQRRMSSEAGNEGLIAPERPPHY